MALARMARPMARPENLHGDEMAGFTPTSGYREFHTADHHQAGSPEGDVEGVEMDAVWSVAPLDLGNRCSIIMPCV